MLDANGVSNKESASQSLYSEERKDSSNPSTNPHTNPRTRSQINQKAKPILIKSESDLNKIEDLLDSIIIQSLPDRHTVRPSRTGDIREEQIALYYSDG